MGAAPQAVAGHSRPAPNSPQCMGGSALRGLKSGQKPGAGPGLAASWLCAFWHVLHLLHPQCPRLPNGRNNSASLHRWLVRTKPGHKRPASRSPKSKARCPRGGLLLRTVRENLLLGLWVAVFVFTWCSLHVCLYVQTSPSYQDPGRIGPGPTLMASF